MYVKRSTKAAKKTFEFQQDESDCGVAALASIIQFHGGYIPLERLRALSGTTASGTTMLGLLQAGEEAGLVTEAFEGNVEELKKLSSPSLLHVVKHDIIEHYIVCYEFDGNKFLIGDPEDGIKNISESDLNNIWKSKALLTFSKSSEFVSKKKITKSKYDWIRRALMDDQRLIVSTLLIGTLISLLAFSTAIFTEKLVDNLIPSKDTSIIILGLCAWFILLIIRSGLTYLRELVLLKQAFRLNLRLTGHFITKLIHLPKSFFDSRKKGDLIARLFDTGRVQTTVAIIISQDIIDILTILVAITFVTFYQATIAAFLLILIPVYFMIIQNYYSKIYKANKAVMASYARNEASYIDILTGIETIKQQVKETSETRTLISNFKYFQKNILSVGRIGTQFKLNTDIIGLLSMFFILTYCVTSVLNNSIQLGDMLAIFSVSTIALNSTNRLAFAVSHLQEAKAALDRTYDVVSLTSEASNGSELKDLDTIQFQNVSFRFPGHTSLFSDVNFKIKKGNISVLVGENGSGKSTILQIIQKFYSPVGGLVLIDDVNIEEINPRSLRQCIGVVPQQIKIFNQSIAYNICLSHEITDEEVLNSCDELGLNEFIDSFREGIHTILGEEGVKVSGGQRQLIALARALFSRPKFLLLDEFTSSMDRETETFALDLVNRLKSKIGILIITHDPRLHLIATTKYNLSAGKITISN